MTSLIIGLALWWLTHLLPIQGAALRAKLAGTVGNGPVKAGIAVLTILAVYLMVTGYQAAPYTEIWSPPAFLTHLNNLLMLLAVFVFIAGNIPSKVRRKVRNPQLTAVKIWALAHLLVNGDLASVILFGGMMAWAVVAVIGTKRRDGPRTEEPVATKQGLIIHVVAGVGVFVIVALLHLKLGGISPFPG